MAHKNAQTPKRQERTCEHLQGKKKLQRDKAAFYARNPHLKWNERG